MKKNTILITCLLLFLCSFSHANANEGYIIGKGDSLTITVWGEQELSTNVVVRPDGKISLPNIGEMTAAGVSPNNLRARISYALKEILFNPIVSVSVNSFPANSVIVYGPGTVSGVFPIQGKSTLLQILSSVKPAFQADLKNAYLERNGEKIASDFESLYKEGVGENADLEILAADRLFIPLKDNLVIFVEGAVNSPKSIPYTSEITILEAIHLAGGFSKFAKPNKTIITRKTNNNVERINVRLSDLIDEGDMSQNITLQGGDLIVVDTGWF